VINWVFLNPPDAVEAALGPTVLCSLSDLVCYCCVFSFFDSVWLRTKYFWRFICDV